MDSLYYSTLALWPDLWTCISLSISLSRSFSLCHMHPDLNKHSHAHARAHTHTYLAGFQSLRGGGISSLLLRGATPNAACMMVMNFLYFMVKLLWVNLLPWQLWSVLPVRRCFPAAELRAECRTEETEQQWGGDDEIKQQNSRVPICVEALLLHNSDRKSHYRRIIAALSLWVLRVVIHNIRPPLFSFSLIRSLLNTLESESILFLFLSRPFCYTSWMCGPCPAGQQMRSLIVHIQISRVGDYWEDELDWVRSLWSQRQDKESLCHLVLVMHLFVSWYCSDRKHENFHQHRWMMLSCCIHSCPTLPVQLSGSSVRTYKCTSQTCSLLPPAAPYISCQEPLNEGSISPITERRSAAHFKQSIFVYYNDPIRLSQCCHRFLLLTHTSWTFMWSELPVYTCTHV